MSELSKQQRRVLRICWWLRTITILVAMVFVFEMFAAVKWDIFSIWALCTGAFSFVIGISTTVHAYERAEQLGLEEYL